MTPTVDPPDQAHRPKTGRRRLLAALAAAVVSGTVGLVAAACSDDEGEPSPDAASGFIEGRVTSGESRPEAGVWVIAETEELPTPYRKIVVTDDDGRFVLPELPDAGYSVWVRGYGLADSEKVPAQPGEEALELTATAADAQQAAEIYPANYWLSLFEPPDKSGEWSSDFKLGCELCHQMGALATRIPTGAEGFDQGLKKATNMDGTADRLGEGHGGRDAFVAALADWSSRIKDGEVPEAPPRPQGDERNMVITQWAWGDQFTYAHDEVATDKRDPSMYANGKIWGVDLGNDRLLSVDPMSHEADMIDIPTRDGFSEPWCSQTFKPLEAGVEPESSGFGSLGCPTEDGATPFEGAYDNPANPHNPMMDDTGKVWMSTQIRREWAEDMPAWCQDDPVIMESAPHHRQLGYYDTQTEEIELIDTCFNTHHLQFDEEGVIWFSNDQTVVGWFDPSKYDPENPDSAGEAQGWSAMVVDSDGDGEKDTPAGGSYGVIPNPSDGSVWLSSPSGGVEGARGGHIARYDPETDTHETYNPPAPGFGPRGVDVDSKGMIWAGLGGSGHLARFDRSKCKRTWGTGGQCAEGWTIWRAPGPKMKTGPGRKNETSADYHYYIWVDQFDTLGMGADTVILNGTGSDSLLAFDPESEKFTKIRIPYPLNVFSRGLDGRIDDPEAGWKGRGLWFDNGLDPIIHSEVPQSFVGKVQYRPDPLAR